MYNKVYNFVNNWKMMMSHTTQGGHCVQNSIVLDKKYFLHDPSRQSNLELSFYLINR